MTGAFETAMWWGALLNAFVSVFAPAVVILVIIIERMVRKWGGKK
jgi:hypothetical protein